MKIKFLDEAKIELDDAYDYYENQEVGLGDQFMSEVLSGLDRIVNFPKAWHPLSNNIRRCQMRIFPYGLIYTIIEKETLIISVSNLLRKPTHWKDRLK